MDSQVIEFLQSKQISVIQEDIDTKLNVWESWYKGHVDGFHTYQIYGGKKKNESTQGNNVGLWDIAVKRMCGACFGFPECILPTCRAYFSLRWGDW